MSDAADEGRCGDERASLGLRHGYPEIIGRSPALLELLRLVDRVADSDATVVIEGENGTGKELVARALHAYSHRRERPFVVQNCAALNDNLLESELFGHRRGAFTGAVVDKQGLFQAADGGTLFLDEIGETSPALQVKLLRVLQEGSFTPVGTSEPVQVDVRLVAATHRDLRLMVQQGQLREDFYWRIQVIPVRVPPLRERPEDLEPLIAHFLGRHAARREEHAAGSPAHAPAQPKQLSAAALGRLRAHPWPGNVRELENELERLVVLSGSEPLIEESLLSARLREDDAGDLPSLPQLLPLLAGMKLPRALAAVERLMIQEALRLCRGNKTRAADRLGVSRRNLIRKVQLYEK